MKIGVPNEMSNGEYRVGMTEEGTRQLVSIGAQVYIASGAGMHSGISDEMYEKSGATILRDAEKIYETADLIVKVKPPTPKEYEWMRSKQMVFSYVLPERHPELCEIFIKKQITAVGYEGVEDEKGRKPLLFPMSELAGKMAVLMGGKLLQVSDGGKGLLLGSMAGVLPAEIMILGAGTAAKAAALMAAGTGCNVTVLNRSIWRLQEIEQTLGLRIRCLSLNEKNLLNTIKFADILVNTIDQMGKKDHHLITRQMLKEMKKKSVIIDVACDMNGTIETSRPTTHDNPAYLIDDIIHCAIPNLPGIIPITATAALAEMTLPYIMKIAKQGIKNATLNDSGLRKGLCFYEGKLLHKKAAENFQYNCFSFENCLCE